jgi:chaperonin GroES
MLRPLGDRIVVKPGAEEEVTRGGIVLPDMARKKPQEGTVIAVGPGKVLESGQRGPMEVAVGDVVFYTKYGGTEVTLEGEDYVLLEEGSVLAVNPDPKPAAKTPEKKAKR